MDNRPLCLPGRIRPKTLLWLVICITFLVGSGFGYSFLFPNLVYYERGNLLELSTSFEGFSVLMSPRFLMPTVWTYRVQDPVIAALIKTESDFILHNRSSSNALGIYQMKPFFASSLGIWNPFFPWNEQKVSGYLEDLQKKYGSLRAALTIYHRGEAGYLSMKKDSNASDKLYNYAEKIEGFQRQYSKGQTVRLKDFWRIGLGFSSSWKGGNSGQMTVVAPTAWFGTSAAVLTVEDAVRIELCQEFMISSQFQVFVGYRESAVIGCSFRSQTWNDVLAIRYDFGTRELSWEGKFEKSPLFFSLSGSVEAVTVRCGFIFDNRYQVTLGLKCGASLAPFFSAKAVF